MNAYKINILVCWTKVLENPISLLQDASSSLGIPLPFVSVIILPIAGNAAEHAGAIIFAMKDKLVSQKGKHGIFSHIPFSTDACY